MSVNYNVPKSEAREGKENHLNLAETSNTPPAKKPWILASLVLFLEVGCGISEAQFTAVGFGLSKNETILDQNGSLIAVNAGRAFEAPYLYTACQMIARSTAFPLMFFAAWLGSLMTRKEFSPKTLYNHCSKVAGPGPEGITIWSTIKLFALPTLFSIGLGVGYINALVYVAPSISSACMAAVVALSYILSILVLKYPHLIIKTVFVIISFGGVAMVAYETTQDPLKSDAYIGIIAVLLACISLALHQLFYSKSFPEADLFQSAFIVSVMSFLSLFVYWPVPLAVKLAGIETWAWSDIPWGYLLGAMTASLGYALFYAYGLALSSPFFMSLGELLNLTGAGLVDHFARGVYLGPLQISGFAVIGLSFVILLMPDRVLTVAYVTARLRNTFLGTKSVNIPHDNVPLSEPKKGNQL